MALAQFETWLNADLAELPRVQSLSGVMFTQDVMGNKVGVTVTNGGENYTITGTITGYVIRGDNSTVVIAGDSDSNKAWIELNEQAYAIPGPISIMIRETVGDVKTVLCACRTTVMRSSTDSIVDPGQVLPSVDELIAVVEALEEQIDVFDARLGDVKFLTKNISANNGTWVFTFSGTCSLHIITNSSLDTLRSDIWVYCTGAGAVSTTKQLATGSSSTITLTAATNKLTVTNTSSYACYAVAIVYGNPNNVTA